MIGVGSNVIPQQAFGQPPYRRRFGLGEFE